jgi:hypothetical protein
MKCKECKIDAAEFDRLINMEARLTMAIEAHSLYIENIQANPYGGAVLSKKTALEFTLGILTDIRDDQ